MKIRTFIMVIGFSDLDFQIWIFRFLGRVPRNLGPPTFLVLFLALKVLQTTKLGMSNSIPTHLIMTQKQHYETLIKVAIFSAT